MKWIEGKDNARLSMLGIVAVEVALLIQLVTSDLRSPAVTTLAVLIGIGVPPPLAFYYMANLVSFAAGRSWIHRRKVPISNRRLLFPPEPQVDAPKFMIISSAIALHCGALAFGVALWIVTPVAAVAFAVSSLACYVGVVVYLHRVDEHTGWGSPSEWGNAGIGADLTKPYYQAQASRQPPVPPAVSDTPSVEEPSSDE
jgi:hypothetical protein